MSQIFINRDGQKQGPYTLDQVQACVIIGTLKETDSAWYDGLPEWMPLSSVITQLQQHGESRSDDWQRKVPTPEQKAELRCLGLRVKHGLTQGDYQELIDKACIDPTTKSKLEVFRLKKTKEKEFWEFILKNNFKLGMEVPSHEQLRETIDFLHDSIPGWAAATSPKQFAKIILTRYPNLKGTWESHPGTDEIPDFGDEQATERQLAYLKDLGARFQPDISKSQASELIDRCRNRASDAQKRRLSFYGLDFDPDITKEEASTLIDSYRTRHPESEDAYQEWKIRNRIA
ncbi:MAG TPA: GYF domain-containing protein [Chthoniobacterales bacterium]|nr:GYF domain-containing protein [Chthoniobacterales bacterium]